jgi:N-carbamoylputrescine amidase
MHIPDDPQYYEKFYFTPGDLGFKSFNTNHGKIGTLICCNQWFPEAALFNGFKRCGNHILSNSDRLAFT